MVYYEPLHSDLTPRIRHICTCKINNKNEI